MITEVSIFPEPSLMITWLSFDIFTLAYILLTFVYIIYILQSSDLVQPKKMNILSLFTHPRVVSNQYGFFFW